MYKLFVLSACKDTTNNPNMQVFMQKNAKNLSFFLYICVQITSRSDHFNYLTSNTFDHFNYLTKNH